MFPFKLLMNQQKRKLVQIRGRGKKNQILQPSDSCFTMCQSLCYLDVTADISDVKVLRMFKLISCSVNGAASLILKILQLKNKQI